MKDDGRLPPPPGAEGVVSLTRAPRPSRDHLLVSAWRKRDLPLRDFLLGGVFCTTSRWLIYGDTGVGKTLLALDLAGAMAAMAKFLDWDGTRKARIMVIDGEMPAETFKDRLVLIGDLYGNEIAVYGYNRDDLIAANKGVDVMHPLDTEAGQRWLWREIEIVKPDVIIFDSVKYLLSGVMSEEEGWAKVVPLIGKLTNQHIGQIWLHHTGHDTTKSFGTKTREWGMDVVIALTKTESDMRILMEFKKARLRTPKTAFLFRPRVIERTENGWVEVEGAAAAIKPKGVRSETSNIKFAIIKAYDKLADAVEPSSGFTGERVLKVSVDSLRERVKSEGFLDTKVDGDGGLTTGARSQFRRAKTDLLNSGQFVEKDGAIWRVQRSANDIWRPTIMTEPGQIR
jgi:AAA domain